MCLVQRALKALGRHMGRQTRDHVAGMLDHCQVREAAGILDADDTECAR
jgi:hypothetical protein